MKVEKAMRKATRIAAIFLVFLFMLNFAVPIASAWQATPESNPFTDVRPGQWHHDYISWAYENNITTGTSATTFGPDSNVTRAQFATFIYRISGQPDISQMPAIRFTDNSAITNLRWAVEAIRWAAGVGVTTGFVNDNTFRPGNNISREQIATMLYRFAGNVGADTESPDGVLAGFPDREQVSGWALEAMQWAVHNGIISGMNGNLAPGQNATRAQSVTMLNRFVERLNVIAPHTDSAPIGPLPSFTNPDEDGSITGSGPINRVQWLQRLNTAAGLQANSYVRHDYSSFDDVDINNPWFETMFPNYQGAVEVAYQNRVIDLPADGLFYPSLSATESFAVITAVRALGFIDPSTPYDEILAIARDIGLFTTAPTTTNLTNGRANALISVVENIVRPPNFSGQIIEEIDYAPGIIWLEDHGIPVVSINFNYSSGLGHVDVQAAAGLFSIGQVIVLPPYDEYLSGRAMKIVSIQSGPQGTLRLLTENPTFEDLIAEDGGLVIHGTFETDIENFVVNPNLQADLGSGWDMINTLGDNSFSTMSTSGRPFIDISHGFGGGGRNFIKVTVGTEQGNDKLSLSASIYEPTVNASIDIRRGWFGVPIGINHAHISVNNRIETSASGTIGIINEKILLGRFIKPLGPTGLTANINFYLDFSLEGTVAITYSVESVVGVEIVNNRPRFFERASESMSVSVSAKAKAGARAQVVLALLGVLHIADVNASVGVAGTGTMTVRSNPPPEVCISVGFHIFLRLDAFRTGVISWFVPKVGLDIWNDKNSPFRRSVYWEDGVLLDKCTCGHNITLPNDVNLSFEGGLEGWQPTGDVRAIRSLGPISPTHGNFMAIIGTGFGAVTDSHSNIRRTFSGVPSNLRFLMFDFNFVTEEVQSYYGSQFDDTVIINIIADGVTHEIYRTSVNSVPLSQWISTGQDLFPGGDIVAHQIGWRELTIDISAYNTFTLEVRIYDIGDSLYDSAALLDNVRFSQTPGTTVLEQPDEPLMIIPSYPAHDRSELSELLEYAKTIDISSYHSDIIKSFEDLLHRAKWILINEDVTQQDVDIAIAALRSAIDGLSNRGY
jgi:hypothetical protein